MGQGVVEKTSLKVPAGEGYIVGDILRKYAIRSEGTWQVIGYKVNTGTPTPNFGFSSGALVSYLDLLRGTLVYDSAKLGKGNSEPQLKTFTWKGDRFVSGEFELYGLNRSVGDTLVVAIAYGHGHRSADQNRDLVKQLENGSADGYFVVPSAHSSVSAFRYTVDPIDFSTEWLNIEADPGVVDNALSAAVRTLAGLNI